MDIHQILTNTMIGRKFTIYTLKPKDLEKGEFKSPWIPTYAPNLSEEEIKNSVIPFISGWAMGVYQGVADVPPTWNKRFPDIEYQSVEEMLTGAWARIQAGEHKSK